MKKRKARGQSSRSRKYAKNANWPYGINWFYVFGGAVLAAFALKKAVGATVGTNIGK